MILHGRDLFIKNSSDSHFIAGAKSCDITVDCDEKEVSKAAHGNWKWFEAGRKSWSVNLNYLVMEGSMTADVLKVGTKVTLKVTDPDGTQLTGQALVKTCNVVGTLGNLTTGSFQFRGSGPLL